MRSPLLQESYDTRAMRFLELWREWGWALKVYGIAYKRDRPRAELVEAARTVARERVVPLAEKRNHYGVGFIVAHDGRDATFVFVDYWADENELRHHVYVSPSEHRAGAQAVMAATIRTPESLPPDLPFGGCCSTWTCNTIEGNSMEGDENE